MAQKSKRSMKNGTKGAIPTVQEGVEKAKQGVKGFLFGRQPEESPGKTAEQNRATGKSIVASLEAVDFSQLKNVSGVTPEIIEDFRMSRKALVTKLNEAGTIFDKIERLDSILLRAADTLNTAVKMGYVNQAEWCVNAISTGLLLLRDNVPPQRSEFRERIIESRIAYMENYEKLIIAYGKIDGNNIDIQKRADNLRSNEEKLAKEKQQLKDILNTPEGAASRARIEANLNQPGVLSKEDQELELRGKRAGDLASMVVRLRNMQFAQITENQAETSIAMGFRAALDILPKLYHENLVSDYAVLLKEMNIATNKMLNNAASALQVEKQMEEELEQIMNSEAAQELAAFSAKSIERVLMPENRITKRDLLEAEIHQRKIKRAQQQELENAELLKKMVLISQENTELNLNQKENKSIDFNYDTDENAQTNTQQNVNDNTEDTSDYNLNS